MPPLLHHARRGGATLVLAGLVAALLALTAGPASAHDELVGTDPADGAVVGTFPGQVTATWAEAPDRRFATLTVVGPDGAHYEAGPATVQGERVVVGVRPGPAGRYQVGYRIVSDDGHPVAGSVTFTATAASPAAASAPAPGSTAPAPGSGAVGAAAPGSAAPGTGSDPPATPQPAASSAPAPDDGSGGVPVWAIVLVAVVVIGGAVALTLRRRA